MAVATQQRCIYATDFVHAAPSVEPHSPLQYDAATDTAQSTQDDATIPQAIALSERAAAMGLCSRDEAENILRDASDYSDRSRNNLHSTETLEQAFYVNGRIVLEGISAHVSPGEEDIQLLSGTPVRLAKRMSELGICSRREAIAILKETGEWGGKRTLDHLKEVVYLRGKPVLEGTAVKVHPSETRIEIRAGDDPPKENEESKDTYVPYGDRPWDQIMGDTIVLNKPIGYVSGQEDHQHVPAVRLLNRSNMHLDAFDEKIQREYREGDFLNFARWKFAEYDLKKTSVPRHIRETLRDDQLEEKSKDQPPETLSGYACTGRLDIDSTGVLIFTRAGIMAQRLLKPESKIPKEYIVKVRPAIQPTALELESGITRLPRPTMDIELLKRKGNRLWNEPRALKPLVEAEWLDDGTSGGEEETQKQQPLTMRLVMVEGKKRQIRRMCRELLGWHVVELVRTAVGPVQIDSLPEGKWRPLAQKEVKAIFEEQPLRKWKSKNFSKGIAREERRRTEEFPDPVEVIWAMEEVLKERDRFWNFKRLRKLVEQSLSFDPSDKKKKWERYMRQVIHEHPGMDIEPKGKRVLLRKEWKRIYPSARRQTLDALHG
ncbi:hypothetical protein ACHAXT_006996 [Thalassiosira profunda]